MASDESHDDIIAEVRARWQGCEDVSLAELDGRDLLALIDRLKAAHKRELDRCAIIAGASLADVVEEKYKREVAQLRECLREAVVEKCTECHQINDYESDIDIEWQMCKGCEVKRWRKALEGAK